MLNSPFKVLNLQGFIQIQYIHLCTAILILAEPNKHIVSSPLIWLCPADSSHYSNSLVWCDDYHLTASHDKAVYYYSLCMNRQQWQCHTNQKKNKELQSLWVWNDSMKCYCQIKFITDSVSILHGQSLRYILLLASSTRYGQNLHSSCTAKFLESPTTAAIFIL